jgi:hypothetical protein
MIEQELDTRINIIIVKNIEKAIIKNWHAALTGDIWY